MVLAPRDAAILAQALPTLNTLVDPDGAVRYYSPSWLAFTGATDAEVCAAGLRPFTHPDDLEAGLAAWNRAQIDGDAFELTVRLRSASGEYRSFLGQVVPIKGADGRIEHWVSTYTDIDRQQRLTDALRISDERWRRLAEAMPILIGETSADGEILYLNKRWGAYTGRTLDGLRDGWIGLVHPDEQKQVEAAIATMFLTGEPARSECRLLGANGKYRWHLGFCVPVADGAGTIVSWVAAFVDIEARKRGEMQERLLASATSEMAASLDTSEILTQLARLSVPALGDICSIGLFDDSPLTARVETAGVSAEEQPHVARIHLRQWREAPGSSRLIGEAMRAGDVAFVPEFSREWIEACAPDEQQRAAAVAVDGRALICAPLRARGETIGMATFASTRSKRRFTERDVAVIVDVLARASIAVDNARLFEDVHRTADELRRANAAKDEFLGLVSHELKTPITMIAGNAEVLQRRFDQLEPKHREEALGDIIHETERLHRIIENLLVLARLDRGQQLASEPLLVPRLVERLATQHERAHPVRTIRLSFPGDLPPAFASQDYVEQILRNLLSNAEKYSPFDEPIDIDASLVDGQLAVRVLDCGAGLHADDLEQVFTPFYRVQATAGQAPGVGIGLAVCRRLVEAQGGTIWARPRPGGGSEFGFTLPVMPDEA